MSLLPTNRKWIGSIATKKKWRHQFFRRSMAANSVVSLQILIKFELIQAFMYVLINTCRYHEDPIINSRHRFSHCLWGYFSDAQWQISNSTVGGRNRPQFKRERDFMHVLIVQVPCKFKKDRIKNNREKVETPFSPL